MKPGEPIPTLAWTGERMVPCQSDAATELFHWQRYMYFRPWYDGAKIVDAASGEGYGTSFAATYASHAVGIDISQEAIEHATKRYRNAEFELYDVANFDYSQADLVMSFETIEHVDDPKALLEAYAKCQGRIVISTPNRKTHSPGNKLTDKPFNSFHTIEWTPYEFAELIRSTFEGRQVRFLSQEGRWPGLIREGLDDDAMYCIAVIGEGELPKWPRLGISMPTVDNAQQALDTMTHLSRFYPGELSFAVVANGSSQEALDKLREFESTAPYMVKVLPQAENLGYGVGANIGLADLLERDGFDLYAVTNDDVVATPTTLIELVMAWKALSQLGQKIGVIGPVSNKVAGQQWVEFPEVSDLNSMLVAAETLHAERHSNVSEHYQIRGLFMLITPDCLAEVGGFDPRFNIGNFEDDDHNLRCRLAGYSLWIADGAFLFHHGSQTFGALMEGEERRYNACMERNSQIFRWKWDLMELDHWPLLQEAPAGVDLFVPVSARAQHEFTVNVEGVKLDLYTQLSDVEFVKWIYDRLQVRHRDERRALAKYLLDTMPSKAVVHAEVEEPSATQAA